MRHALELAGVGVIVTLAALLALAPLIESLLDHPRRKP